jgi:hypothetical protein
MAWFKVDDGFWSHPKTLALSNDAVALWVRAGTWSCQQLTDGFIADHALPMFGNWPKAVAELVEVGYWDRDSERVGHVFHDWSDYQEESEKVKARREAARERMKAVRANGERTKHERSSERAPNVSRSSLNPDPTRPDPTRPVSKDTSPTGGAKGKESRIPADWAPSKAHFDLARELKVNITTEADSFRLHAETHDRHAVRWNAAFTMWLKKAKPTLEAKRDPNAWMNVPRAARA